MVKTEIVVLGTHEYQWLLKPFMFFFRKYWGSDPITYVGDRLVGPLPEGLDFMRVPAYSEGVWPWEHWFGNGLLSLLKELTEPLAVTFLPDHWIAQPANVAGIKKLAGYMLDRGNVVRGNLKAGMPIDTYGKMVDKWEGLEITSVGPTDIHAGLDGGTAFCPSMWNVKLLSKIIEPHWGLWACEKLGTEKMAREFPDLMSVGTRPPLLHCARALTRNVARRVSLFPLCEEDRQFVLSCMPSGWEAID